MAKRGLDASLLLISFCLTVMLNWLYIRWIKSLFVDILTSWFLMIPIFGYFYFTFAIIAAIFISQKKKLGIVLGCFVIVFGMIADVMSYASVFKMDGVYELLIVPLIVLNCFILVFLAGFTSSFKE